MMLEIVEKSTAQRNLLYACKVSGNDCSVHFASKEGHLDATTSCFTHHVYHVIYAPKAIPSQLLVCTNIIMGIHM